MIKHFYALTLLIFSTYYVMAQRIVIDFDTIPNTPPSVSKATLRYDKDFAYSLTFDDATLDGYSCALPALQGGLSECSGTTQTPLFYTDGCGNNLLFKAGIAWNSANFYGQDSHIGNTPGLLTWTQLNELLSKDWDVLNHSFSHKSRWIQYMPGTEYINEINKNKTEVKAKTDKHYEMPIFVVPSGDTYYQDIAYIQGQKLVFDQSANTIGMGGLAVNTDLMPNGRVVHRQLVEDALNSGQDKIGNVASRSAAGERIWYNEFTHRIDGATGLSFSTFRNHVERIANTWGKNGSDRIWVAGLQEVYEYLTVRKEIKYTATVNGNQLVIDFDLHDLPDWLRRKPLTLVVNSSTSFSSVNASQGITMTYKGTGSKKIINLDFAQAMVINPCDTDVTKPVLSSCPQNIGLTTTGTSAIATWTAPTAIDNCTSNPSVKSNFSSGQSFSIGSTTVVYTATDAKNNSASCSFNIIVAKIIVNPCNNDTTPPVFTTCPQNISLTTTTAKAIATWQIPAATDNCTSNPTVTSNFSSGQKFPLGATNVVYTATDAKNNRAKCSFYILVTQVTANPCDTDIMKPVLSACPKDISLTTTGATAIATWTAPTATDNCTTTPSVKSNFESAQSFPMGSTTVIYTATDAKNNSASCSFNVLVQGIVQNSPDLAISLSTTPNPVIQPYTVAVYRITLKNLSAQNYNNVFVSFPFPQGLVNGGIPQVSTGLWEEYCSNSRLCYEWSINTLAGNASATLDMPLFVLGLSTPITATAKLVSSSPIDNLLNNNQASVTIGGNTAPSVSAAYKTSQKIPIIINKILPNPSIGDVILMVESVDEREASFNISDAFGKTLRVETQKVVKGTNQLLFDMWSLPQGIYFITPTTSLGRGMPVKFVKL